MEKSVADENDMLRAALRALAISFSEITMCPMNWPEYEAACRLCFIDPRDPEVPKSYMDIRKQWHGQDQ